jgi:WD40 repeat protein
MEYNRQSTHSSASRDVAFSENGQVLASAIADVPRSGSGGGGIMLWDMPSAQWLKLLRSRSGVESVAFSPAENNLLASGNWDGTIILWDIVSGRPIIPALLEGHSKVVRSVAFSRDGKKLASGSDDNTVILWDTETGRRLDTPLTSHKFIVRSVAFNPDGHTFCGTWPAAALAVSRSSAIQPLCAASPSAQTGRCWPREAMMSR